MNILHLHTNLNITCGITKSILLMILNSDKDLSHKVFALGGDNIAGFENEAISVFIPKKSKLPLFNHISVILAIIRICRKENIKIIHAHHRYLTLLAWLPSKLLNIPLVVSVQSKVYRYKKLSYKADAIIAVSNSIKNHLLNYYKIDPGKISIINNFTIEPEENDIDLPSIKENLKIENSKRVIVFAGRISKEKGIDILLKSFNIVQSKIHDCLLLIIGSGEEKEAITRYINDNSLNVMLFEPLKSIYNFYRIAELIVLPSRVDPFPLVMLEAGIMKKAFIGSNVDGISECVENNKDGILVEPADSEQLAEAIISLLENKHKAEELGRNLYIKVYKNYLASKLIPEFGKLYKNLIYE